MQHTSPPRSAHTHFANDTECAQLNEFNNAGDFVEMENL
jgi:hypothetical protein